MRKEEEGKMTKKIYVKKFIVQRSQGPRGSTDVTFYYEFRQTLGTVLY